MSKEQLPSPGSIAEPTLETEEASALPLPSSGDPGSDSSEAHPAKSQIRRVLKRALAQANRAVKLDSQKNPKAVKAYTQCVGLLQEVIDERREKLRVSLEGGGNKNRFRTPEEIRYHIEHLQSIVSIVLFRARDEE